VGRGRDGFVNGSGARVCGTCGATLGAWDTVGACAWTGFFPASSQPEPAAASSRVYAVRCSTLSISSWYGPPRVKVNAFRRGWCRQSQHTWNLMAPLQTTSLCVRLASEVLQ
jgi:hypothetical protein